MTTPAHARVAVITGAARGIGAATARRLAAQGMSVALLDRDGDECAVAVNSLTATGVTARAFTVDVSDEGAATGAVAEVAVTLGPPVVLVNNAGFAESADLARMTTEQWSAVLSVVLDGPFYLTRAAVPYMVDAGWGRIVNISSISALGDPGRVGYASAKAGLLGFTRTLATELGPHGITCNAIGPGFVVSAMTARSARRLGHSVEDYQRLAAEQIPVGRVGQPEDIARAVAFFTDEDAGFVTGQTLYVGLSCRVGGESSVREVDVDAGAAEVDHRDQGVG